MTETYTPDKLLAGDYPAVTDIVTILEGENLVRGACLGKITASGKHVIVNSAGADDGRRAPVAILAEDCDASEGDAQALVYLSGAFNESAVVFGGADTVATHRAALRDLNIYLKKPA
jgi:hypothetical protein